MKNEFRIIKMIANINRYSIIVIYFIVGMLSKIFLMENVKETTYQFVKLLNSSEGFPQADS